MHDLIEFFKTNADLVFANPTAFMTFAILFGGGGFVVGRYFLTERIANLESRIARRDEEIAALSSRPDPEAAWSSLLPVLGTSIACESGAAPLVAKQQAGAIRQPVVKLATKLCRPWLSNLRPPSQSVAPWPPANS